MAQYYYNNHQLAIPRCQEDRNWKRVESLFPDYWNFHSQYQNFSDKRSSQWGHCLTCDMAIITPSVRPIKRLGLACASAWSRCSNRYRSSVKGHRKLELLDKQCQQVSPFRTERYVSSSSSLSSSSSSSSLYSYPYFSSASVPLRSTARYYGVMTPFFPIQPQIRVDTINSVQVHM